MNELIMEGFMLKSEIDRKTARLREINKQLADQADFDGKKSAKLVGEGVIAKVALRENIKWDQSRLEKASHHFGFWNDCFKIEFKPIMKAVNAAMAHDKQFADAIEWARTVTPGAPSVTYETVEENDDAA